MYALADANTVPYADILQALKDTVKEAEESTDED